MKKHFSAFFVIVGTACIIVILVFGFVRLSYPIHYKKEIEHYSEKYVLESSLVFAVVNTESSFDRNAVSVAGAVGLMQIMPSTGMWIASVLGYENFSEEFLYMPEINIEFGCFYLNYLFDRFDLLDHVLCAYNLGETKTRALILENEDFYMVISDYKETYEFIKRVNKAMSIYDKFV